MTFSRLQTTVLNWPSQWDCVLNDTEKEDVLVLVSVGMKGLFDTWLYKDQLEFIGR